MVKPEECDHDFDYFREEIEDGQTVIVSNCKYCDEEYREGLNK
ncbi:MAG: hypothetical protein ACRD5J_02840 [Nitrososphaeraceae archaeon]